MAIERRRVLKGGGEIARSSAAARRVRGLTLVEMLATIAIIGLLAALLLPALQSGRETARRAHCGNNLRQIGVGVLAHANNNNDMLPAGLIYVLVRQGVKDTYFYHGTATNYILPYIEQQRVYDTYDMSEPPLTANGQFTAVARDNIWTPMINSTTYSFQFAIPTYVCPSDPPAATRPATSSSWISATGRLNYIASAGPTTVSVSNCATASAFNTFVKPGTGSIGVPGAFGVFRPGFANVDAGNVPIHRSYADARCKLAEIRDGQGDTIFFGESLPDCWGSTMGWGFIGNGNGGFQTTVPLNYNTCDPGPAGDGKPTCNKPNSGMASGFRSRHPGVVGFLMGDGAVRFVSELIDHETLQRLGAKADRLPIMDSL